MWQRQQLLYGLAVALVAALYLGAEHGVRKAVYPPLDDKTRTRAMQTVMESMPAFLRSALERHGRVQRLRERLAAATAAAVGHTQRRRLTARPSGCPDA